MFKSGSLLKRFILIAAIAFVTGSNSGCKLLWGFAMVAYNYSIFWVTTTPIPVSPYYSQLIEDTYKREERYDKVPILDQVEGDHAPIFCQDPPSPDEVMMALPDEVGGGWTFLAETQRNNVRITVEPMVDRMDECRFYPLVGPAKLHHCHYKCTVYYDKVIRSDWPVPFRHKDETIQVVYIDHDHLIRCAGPETPQ
jgi:hypothetical protein